MWYCQRVLLVCLVLTTGCKYDAPLSDQHSVPVDPALLGLWHQMPEEAEAWSEQRLLILKYSDTEYLIHYPADDKGLYYRAYGIEVGGISCVQLQILADGNGRPPNEGDENLYHVVRPRWVKGRLEIKVLNTDVVDDHLQGTDALQKTFVANADHEDLFVHPTRFVRLGQDH